VSEVDGSLCIDHTHTHLLLSSANTKLCDYCVCNQSFQLELNQVTIWTVSHLIVTLSSCIDTFSYTFLHTVCSSRTAREMVHRADSIYRRASSEEN